jgi:peptide/nickel transport system substrate-binding protein
VRRFLSATLALSVLVTGCSKVAQTTEVGGRANSFTVPHVLRWADPGDIKTLNPHLGQFAMLGWLSSLTMAWLVKFDAQNQAVPELATVVPTQANGGVSKDGLTITYHLRHGVKWSDGAPFDADDVVFSTNVVNNLANNEVGRQGWDQITKVDEPDKYTVAFHLKKPYSPFIEVFFSSAGANPCILPKHILGNLPNINYAAYNSLPVGIGPFKYQSWARQQQIVMVPNPYYFRGQPKLQKIILKIGVDRNTLLTQVQAKEVDLWAIVSGNYVARLKEIAPYDTMLVPSYYWNHVDFNLSNKALADPVVRHALLYALDRQGILEKIGHGLGKVADTPTPVNAPYYVNLPVTPFDPKKANAMLEQDGWKMGADGVRAKGNLRLSFTYAAYVGTPDVDNQIELERAGWKAIGVELNVRHYPPAIFFAPLPEGIVYSTKYDITGFAWLNDAIGDYSQPYGCDAIPPNGQNNTRWVNKKACAAMTNLYSHYDQASRNKDVAVIVKALADDAPAPVTTQRVDIYTMNRDLKNFHPNSITPFDDFMNVDI